MWTHSNIGQNLIRKTYALHPGIAYMHFFSHPWSNSHKIRQILTMGHMLPDRLCREKRNVRFKPSIIFLWVLNLLATCFMLVSCFAYSLTWSCRRYFSDTSVDSRRIIPRYIPDDITFKSCSKWHRFRNGSPGSFPFISLSISLSLFLKIFFYENFRLQCAKLIA